MALFTTTNALLDRQNLYFLCFLGNQVFFSVRPLQYSNYKKRETG